MQLKPCPFCGGTEPQIERIGTSRQSSIVSCTDCGARLEANESTWNTGSQWNTRLEPNFPTPVLHKARHELLHRKLDELVSDYLTQHPDKRPSNTTVLELMTWSAEEAQNPTGDGA